MALHDSYGDFNKRTQYGRVVSWSAEPVTFSSERLEPRTIYWKAKRRSKTRFEYFGMEKTTAEACVRDMREKFTRNYMRWKAILTEIPNDYPEVTADTSHIVECGTGIEMTNPAGDNYSVEVDVDEIDEIITKTEPKTADDFEDIFQAAELRDGDGGIDGIAIGSANWNGVPNLNGLITVLFTHTIGNFDISKLDVQVWSSDGWQTFQTVQKQGLILSFAATSNVRLRLTYDNGRHVSRSITSQGFERHKFMIESAKCSFVAAETSVVRGSQYVDWGGVAEIAITVVCDMDIPYSGQLVNGNMVGYIVNSTIGSQSGGVEPYGVERLGYSTASGGYRYIFKARQTLPPEAQPFSGVVLSVRPFGDLRFVESEPVTINQTDYINIEDVTAVKVSGNAEVKVRFRTNLSLPELSPDAAWCYLVGLEGQQYFQIVEHFDATYASLGEGLFEASFRGPIGTYDRALASISGTKSGSLVQSVWRQVAYVEG